MAHLQHRLKAFVKLGDFFREFCDYSNNSQINSESNNWFDRFDEKIALAGHTNGWFTKENILYGIAQWGELLTHDNLQTWLSKYTMDNSTPKNVAIIMAGNIPLVGFHDFLSTLITGNKVQVKLSSNDTVLLPFITEYLIAIEPSFTGQISFVTGKLEDFDAVIATGSDNTARYFEYYFGKKPNIIRKNRSSVAVLTGNETPIQLQKLGDDIFRYYGLGCRSVSKLFVPKDYDFDTFFTAIFPFKYLMDQAKYANNYDYNKAVYLMSEFKILENGFVMLKEDTGYSSPIATVFYEHYGTLQELKEQLNADKNNLQCIVAENVLPGEIAFGKTQCPSLWDYADDLDTVEFLLKT
ncbi:acyl-CoA reductase [Spongiimicrobium sp. 3-5]|uniref:acyl-CoA reductase n=1 Tax=Spongiimicrobium sp. 3-5 TaxID=3332596 RepID=UPI0039801A35